MITPPPEWTSHMSEVAAQLSTLQTPIQEQLGDWEELFGQVWDFCHKVGSYMTSPAQDLDH